MNLESDLSKRHPCDSLVEQLEAAADTCSVVSLRKNLEEDLIDGGSSQSKC